MAPPTSKKQKKASSSASQEPIDSLIGKWLYDSTARERWSRLQNMNFLKSAFVVFPDFQAYQVRERATQGRIESLLDSEKNNIPINHTMVKLFIANLNLGHQKIRGNVDECLWSMVCGKKIFLPIDRIAHILETPSNGILLDELNCVLHTRDRISHQFMDDHMNDTKSINLRPTARILHRAMMLSILQRSGTYDQVYQENFRALYAIYGEVNINWPQMIINTIMSMTHESTKHIYYAEYIMRLIKPFDVNEPIGEISHVKLLDKKSIKLMRLPPPTIRIMPYEDWLARTQSGHQHQPPAPPRRDEVRLPTASQSPSNKLDMIAKNQILLEARQKRQDKKLDKMDKKLNKIKSFFNILWDAISCSAGTSSQDPGKRPAPHFTWTTSEETTSSSTGASGATQHEQRKGKGVYIRQESDDDDDDETQDD